MVPVDLVHEDFQLDARIRGLRCGRDFRQARAFRVGVRLRINNVRQDDAPPEEISRSHLRVAPAQLAQVPIAWDVKNAEMDEVAVGH